MAKVLENVPEEYLSVNTNQIVNELEKNGVLHKLIIPYRNSWTVTKRNDKVASIGEAIEYVNTHGLSRGGDSSPVVLFKEAGLSEMQAKILQHHLGVPSKENAVEFIKENGDIMLRTNGGNKLLLKLFLLTVELETSFINRSK